MSGPGGTWSGGPRFSPHGRLDLHLSEPQRQARWKTLLRGLLVIPNAFVLGFLEVAAAFVTIAMWFATLVTARAPEGMWRFSTGVLQWMARTYAFTMLLTDRYPPFKTGDASYPVSIKLTRPDRFNRLAVLFRIILVVPAAIVVSVFTFGVYVFAIVTWLVTLVLGRCPRSLHLLLAAWLRYELRYSAYYCLLTTEYPSAPLGDPQSHHGSLESGEIVLRGAARAFAVIALVLGGILYVSDLALPAVVGTHASAQEAIAQLNGVQARSTAADVRFRTQVGGCATTWQCVDKGTSILERSLGTQISSIEEITFPTALTRNDANELLSILQEERTALLQMHDAGTQQTFDNDLNHVAALTRKLQPLVLKLQNDLESTS